MMKNDNFINKLNDYIGNLYDQLRSNPSSAILVIMLILFIILLGVILNWDWVLNSPPTSQFSWLWSMGRRTVRIVLGSIMIIGLIGLGIMYYAYTYR